MPKKKNLNPKIQESDKANWRKEREGRVLDPFPPKSDTSVIARGLKTRIFCQKKPESVDSELKRQLIS